MRNKVGQDAFITNGTNPDNIGKRVKVIGYIGYFLIGETFEYNGMVLAAPISDHFFWIYSESGISTFIGETSKAYGPDSWLLPIESDGGNALTRTKEKEVS